MSEKTFHIIGLSDSRDQFLSPDAHARISNGKVFSGGRRHHDIVADLLPSDALWIDIVTPLKSVFMQYEAYDELVVFASGDPLFYGFANTIRREYPTSEVCVYPSFNSLQLLAHRLLMPYADMVNVSLTGRPWKALDIALMEDRRMIGILTDYKKGPSDIASRLLAYGYDNYDMAVGVRLGNEAEIVRIVSLQEAVDSEFENPNCVILRMTTARKRYFGIPESMFAHLEGRSNMITKMPVRLLTLSMMDLYERKVLWDIGFCTGSVSIEAKLRYPALDIIAFERREESERLLEENCRMFGALGIQGVIGDFMDCDLSHYPSPDAVFIGGHGGRLDVMVHKIYDILTDDGVIVFNSVSDESCRTFRNAVAECRGVIVAEHTMILDDHNPITILKAK